ncbi:MAG: ATP-binding protein [Gammaproteobacteria bacterium]|nr:ATP-binding protein [Gammaproteobacteria bacterium]
MSFKNVTVFQYPEGKQLIMRAVFGAISSLYLIIGYFSDTFSIPSPALNIVIIGYFIAILFTFFTMLRWPLSLPRRFFNILVDVIAATTVIYYTGGANSPGFLLYVWLLTSNAMRFRMREVYVSQISSLIAYSFILFTSLDDLTHPVQVAFQYSTLIIFPLYLHKLISAQGKAKKLAQEASRTKSQFLANMSHELRTPLNAIIGYSELMQEDAVEQKQERYINDLSHVLNSSWHLLNMINEVLDIAKIDAGEVKLYYDEADLKTLLNDISHTIEPDVKRNHNTFTTDFDMAPEKIHTDVEKLKQILLNLLSNAAKFTTDGEILFSAKLENISGTPYVQFEVKDSGIGIAVEQQKTIFEPFIQADASSTRQFGGTGLGLSISKRFTEMLGGTIRLASQPGKGSSFSILLPLSH